MSNASFMRFELQTIATCFDSGTMSLKMAKQRIRAYFGVEIKAPSKQAFIKKLAQYIDGIEGE